MKPIRICMASDFFYPNTGGVEAHIWQLSQCLMRSGHTVIVITHAYGERVGIRHMSNGLKVYYLPISLYPNQNIIWPLIFHTLRYVREILLREQIDIVHGHSAFSPLAHEVMFHAKTLGIKTVFTDHSLFGMDDFGAKIHTFFTRLSLLQCNHFICVSHVGRENHALQLKVNKEKAIPIIVIPNAVDTAVFKPDPKQRDPDKITIIVISRLVYRKGIDLLAAVIPRVCILNSRVRFIIAGDGPKRILLEESVCRNNLQDKVTFLGSIPHSEVRSILVKGDIFLNTSLIEAFCMAVVEAASCGLKVVSTNVGGLPSVLPKELIRLTEPNVECLVKQVQHAIEDEEFVTPDEAHRTIKNTYSWEDVAKKTESVYERVIGDPVTNLGDRLYLYHQADKSLARFVFHYIFIVVMLINHVYMLTLDRFYPRKNLDTCPKYRNSSNQETRNKTNQMTASQSPSLKNIIIDHQTCYIYGDKVLVT